MLLLLLVVGLNPVTLVSYQILNISELWLRTKHRSEPYRAIGNAYVLSSSLFPPLWEMLQDASELCVRLTRSGPGTKEGVRPVS